MNIQLIILIFFKIINNLNGYELTYINLSVSRDKMGNEQFKNGSIIWGEYFNNNKHNYNIKDIKNFNDYSSLKDKLFINSLISKLTYLLSSNQTEWNWKIILNNEIWFSISYLSAIGIFFISLCIFIFLITILFISIRYVDKQTDKL